MQSPVLRLSPDLAYSTTPVVLAAGRGQRFGGGLTPKHLAIVRGVPLVVRLLTQFADSMQRRPIIVIDENDNITARVLADWGLDAEVVIQGGGRGPVPAMLSALPHCGENVCVLLGDIFLDGQVREVLHRVPAIAVWPGAPLEAVRANYGVTLSGSSVTGVVEKPYQVQELTCGMGLYILGTRTVRSAAHQVTPDGNGELGVTELMAAIVARCKVTAVMFEGVYINVNRPEDLGDVERSLPTH